MASDETSSSGSLSALRGLFLAREPFAPVGRADLGARKRRAEMFLSTPLHLNASKTAKFDSIAKSVDVQFDATPMAEVADQYTKELLSLGWTIKGSGIRSDEYTFLTFTKEKVELDLRARSMNGNILVNIQGNGLIWTKP